MKIKYMTTYSAIVLAVMLGQICILSCLPLRLYSVVSLGVLAIAAASLLAFMMLFLDRGAEIKKNNAFIAILAVLVLTLAAICFSSGINVQSLSKTLLFLELPVLLLVVNRYKSERLREYIYRVNLCLSFLFLAFYFSGFSHRCVGQYGEFAHESITLGYNNPNEVGMYLMLNFFILLSALFHYKKKNQKVICVIALCIVTFLISKSDARSVIVLSVLVSAFTFLLRALRLSRKKLFVIFCIPLAFALAIVLIPELGDLNFLNESLANGRALMVEVFLKEMTVVSFLFGNYSGYAFSNMHNSFVSIFATIGFFATLAYWSVLFVAYSGICKLGAKTKEKMVLQLGLLAVIVHGAVESSFLVGGSVYAASVFLLAYLVNSENEM